MKRNEEEKEEMEDGVEAGQLGAQVRTGKEKKKPEK